ncbi:hypothetical protein A2U01_0103677 [Trifolium medium]|uniref:Uncharacterized protein n=1 Tax=Trifolium medium TaxID=97028 RepID=A0A392V4S4_9FABA|nr:hypothetical protein [Trifolium medium]
MGSRLLTTGEWYDMTTVLVPDVPPNFLLCWLTCALGPSGLLCWRTPHVRSPADALLK